MDAVRAHFRPEFLNRLDETIIFDRLARADMDGIVDIQLARLAKRLAARNITLELDEDAHANGWPMRAMTRSFGARPLKRVIQRAVQDPLAEMLLAGDVLDGSCGAGQRRPRWSDHRRPGRHLRAAAAGRCRGALTLDQEP